MKAASVTFLFLLVLVLAYTTGAPVDNLGAVFMFGLTFAVALAQDLQDLHLKRVQTKSIQQSMDELASSSSMLQDSLNALQRELTSEE